METEKVEQNTDILQTCDATWVKTYPHTDEGVRHVTEEPGSETETVVSEEKSIAEEIVDESKSE